MTGFETRDNNEIIKQNEQTVFQEQPEFIAASANNEQIVADYFSNRSEEFADVDFSGMQYLFTQDGGTLHGSFDTVLKAHASIIKPQDIKDIQVFVQHAHTEYRQDVEGIQTTIQETSNIEHHKVMLGLGDDDHRLMDMVGAQQLETKQLFVKSTTSPQNLLENPVEDANENVGESTEKGYAPDGTGLDKKELKKHPKVQEYVVGFREGIRSVLGKELQSKVFSMLEGLNPEETGKMQEMMEHSEIINEVLSDRHLDNISLSLLDNTLDQLESHWGDIESTMDSIIAQMPTIMKIVEENKTMFKDMNWENPYEVTGKISNEHQALFESLAENFEVSPALQQMVENLVSAPEKMTGYIQKRVDAHLSKNNLDRESASREELTGAYQQACKVFSSYTKSELLMSDIFAGKDIDGIGFEEGDLESLPGANVLSGVEKKINDIEPKIINMTKRLKEEGGLMSFLHNEETMGKLNKFAQFMSGGKHSNFMSYFKETAIGKLLVGGLQLFEIFTGKETGFDFEKTENKQIIKHATELYTKNDHKEVNNDLDNEQLKLGDYKNDIMYIKEVDGKKQPVFVGLSRENDLTNLNKEDKEKLENMDLDEIIKKDLNITLLGSIAYNHTMGKDLKTFHSAVYGEAPVGKPANHSDLLKEYMKKHFSNALGSFVKGKSKPTISEETVVKIILRDLMDRKKAYSDLDVSVKDVKKDPKDIEKKEEKSNVITQEQLDAAEKAYDEAKIASDADISNTDLGAVTQTVFAKREKLKADKIEQDKTVAAG